MIQSSNKTMDIFTTKYSYQCICTYVLQAKTHHGQLSVQQSDYNKFQNLGSTIPIISTRSFNYPPQLSFKPQYKQIIIDTLH